MHLFFIFSLSLVLFLCQVEFYFSDSNLYRDNFLHDKVKANADGFVDIALLCTFSRMQSLLSDGSGSQKVPDSAAAHVATILKESSTLLVSEDGKQVRRAGPLTKSIEEVTEEVDTRSLYAGPFSFDTSLDSLVQYFESVGEVNCVRMRRHLKSKDFKGSVFVEFSSLAEAERVKGLTLKHDGAKLELEGKVEYMKRKEEERHAKPNSPYNNANQGTGANASANPISNNKRPREDNGADAAAAVAPAPAAAEPVVAVEVQVEPYTSGCIIQFDFGTGTNFADPITFGLVKDSFGGKDRGLQYVEYTPGTTLGHARFATPEAALAALAEAEEGKRLIAGYSAEVKLLEGEAETEYMKKVAQDRAKAENQRKNDTRGEGRRGGRGGRRGGGGRGGRGGRSGGRRQRN